jgi:hypothetical protein
MKTVIAALAASLSLTSAAAASPFNPGTTSRDTQIEAQLRAAPKPSAVSAFSSSFDPAVNASDDRTVLWTWWAVEEETGAFATHDAVWDYIPSMDRAVSERD